LTRGRVLTWVLVAGLLALTNPGLAATPPSQRVQAGGPVVRSAVAGRDERSVAEYWTPSRMANAKPMTLSLASRILVKQVVENAQGLPVSIPPTGPRGVDHALVPKAMAVSQPYSDYPDKLNGKVFFSDSKGNDYECSGTAVNSDNHSLVWTAGHCVHEGPGGHFYDNWVFVPGYLNGQVPFGRWTASQLATTSGWADRGNDRLDFGAAVVRPLNGKRLTDRIGGQGMLFNASRNQKWTVFGYPVTGPFKGNGKQYKCVSGHLGDDYPSGSGPATLKIWCDMTDGSSGGAWLVGLSGGLGKVNGITSYGLNDPKATYGPYQGSDALDLYNYAKKLKP
jgi:V8-like Glu-specific endopeptidase